MANSGHSVEDFKTEGQRLLCEFLEDNDIKKNAVAVGLQVDRSLITLWTTRGVTPETAFRRAIEKYTSGAVPAASWETDAERKIVARVTPFVPTATPETISAT